MSDCKPMDTPISKGQTLSLEMYLKTPEELKAMARVPYSSVIGSLMYAMMCTRPYICYAVGSEQIPIKFRTKLLKYNQEDYCVSKRHYPLLFMLSRR